MSVLELMGELRRRGVILRDREGQLICEAPKSAMTPDLRERTRSHKEEILRILRQSAPVSAAPAMESFRRGPRAGRLPASSAQLRLCFLDQFTPGLIAYNMFRGFRFRGRLEIGALEKAIGEIIRRHDSLRTSFDMHEELPVQVIHQPGPFELAVVDLGQCAPGARDDVIRRLSIEEVRRPFDLAAGPLIRATLLRFDRQDHVLLLALHHIVSDGWSLGLIQRELAALYEAFSRNEPSPLQELPFQYADFAAWQRDRAEGDASREHVDYWTRKLGGMLPVLDLATDRPRPPVQTYNGAQARMRLPGPLGESLRAVGRRAGGTLFMTLLTAFKTLLHRYTGQEDLIVGTPVANRERKDVENIVGFFVNTLPIRTDVSGDPTFQELLARVRATCVEAYSHQDIPLEKVVEAIRLDRDLSRTPLFQVVFALRNFPVERMELQDLSVESFEVDSGVSKLDLFLYLTEDAEGLDAVIEYNTDLFDAGTILRMLGHFQALLEGIAADPAARIGSLPLLGLQERQLLTRD